MRSSILIVALSSSDVNGKELCFSLFFTQRNLPSAHLYNTAVQGLFLRGNIELAFKLYAKMKEMDLNTDNKTRALLLQNLPKDSRRL